MDADDDDDDDEGYDEEFLCFLTVLTLHTLAMADIERAGPILEKDLVSAAGASRNGKDKTSNMAHGQVAIEHLLCQGLVERTPGGLVITEDGRDCANRASALLKKVLLDNDITLPPGTFPD